MEDRKNVELPNVTKISIADKLIHVKGDNGLQLSTERINYFQLTDNVLRIHSDRVSFSATVDMEISTLRQLLPPCFYRLPISETSIICYNARKVSSFVFDNGENVAIVSFSDGQSLSFTVGAEDRDKIFTNLAEHHEHVLRSC